MRHRNRSVLTNSITALAFAFAVGCGKNNNNNQNPGGGGPDGGNPDGGALGSGALTSSSPAVVGSDTTFGFPTDAAPSPDGTTIYFAASGSLGSGIFSVPAAGGAANPVSVGGNIVAPLAIALSSDGNTIYGADPAFTTDKDNGAIFSVGKGGGAAAALNETADYAPRSLAVVKVGGTDNIYFTGNDKTDGSAGIFKDAGGTVSKVLAADAQAIAAYTDGTVYFIDSSGSVQKVAAGGTTATALGTAASGLKVNFPAGIEVSQDGKFVLVPVTAAGKQSIARIDVSSGATTQLGLGLDTNTEAGGIHRAANADVYSFIDSGAGATGGGTIYLLK